MGTQTDNGEAFYAFNHGERVKVQLQQFYSDSVWVIDPKLVFYGTVVTGPATAVDKVVLLPDVPLPFNHPYASLAPIGLDEEPYWVENDDGSDKQCLRFRIFPELLAATAE
ncbi:MAG TPA: hypothetical protein VG992_04815 [Candidatus Saccharimonadales bacterium]|nr:hypothetical protein [Candidatus Saccharimonadales bacterium]